MITEKMMTAENAEKTIVNSKTSVLTLSSIGFTLMFAVWLMFGVLGIPIREEFGLTDVQLSWLAAVAILNGSLWRLIFGILADRFGGEIFFTFLVAAAIIPSSKGHRAAAPTGGV